jgi:hypothetical protein
MTNSELTQKLLGIKDLKVEPLYWEGQDTRKRVVTDSQRNLYGVMGRNYHPVGYGDLYAHVTEWLPEAKVVSSAVGGRNLSKAIITIELPETFDVGGQEIKTYVNLINSLDGSYPIGLIVSPLRVACTNQFVLLRKSAFIEIRQKHTRPGFQAFTREVRVVNEVYNILKGQLAVAEKLVSLPCTTEKGKDFIDKIVKQKIVPEKLGEEAKAFYETPIRPEDEGRNLWTLFNAITEPLNVKLRDKQKLSQFNQIQKVGEVFTELVAHDMVR